MVSQPPLLVAVLADIHSNAAALEAVFEVLDTARPDQIIAAGDLVGRGPEPARTLRLLRSRKVSCIRGNWDEWVGEGTCLENRPKKTALITATRDLLSEHDRLTLLTYPRTLALKHGAQTLLVAHGSPRDPVERMTACTSDDIIRAAIAGTDATIIALGHSHHGFVRRIDDRLVINCGSVGYPSAGDPRASLALIDLTNGTAELVRVCYPVARTRRAMRRLVKRGVVTTDMRVQYLRGLIGNGPEPRTPPGPDERATELLVRVLARRTSNVYRRAAAGWDDGHRVHKVRVATRRLRIALEMLSDHIPAKRCDDVQARLRRLGADLGRARNADVMFEQLARIEARSDLERTAIDRAQHFALVRRRRAIGDLLERHSPDRMVRHGLDLVALMGRPRMNAPTFAESIRKALRMRIDAVQGRLDCLAIEAMHEAQHELRTTIKQLRYTLELAAEALPTLSSQSARAALTSAQTALGDLHDLRELTVFIQSRRVRRRVDPTTLITRWQAEAVALYAAAQSVVATELVPELSTLRARVDATD